uniref:hypothetical protein n=1 Tax=Bacillus pumilus TaxID=1408 RepID=UPI001C92F98F
VEDRKTRIGEVADLSVGKLCNVLGVMKDGWIDRINRMDMCKVVVYMWVQSVCENRSGNIGGGGRKGKDVWG